ncbi:MAG TPA: DUF488 domain-containing protein [Syntrophorhabdaceae bacterium]|jgi:uncharacterized protein (DUF488 family)
MEKEITHPIFTIGHSTRPLPSFVSLLESFDIDLVIDVRTIPRSRHNPQFNKETLPAGLAQHGIGYLHVPGLGGLRKTGPDSPNQGWHNPSFRGFADYMQTDEFRANVEKLMESSTSHNPVLMCAETLPWRCHRSLIADALYVRGVIVRHIFKDGVYQEHRLTPWARVEGVRIVYPGSA